MTQADLFYGESEQPTELTEPLTQARADGMSLTRALAILGYYHTPSPWPGKRRIFNAQSGEAVGDMDARQGRIFVGQLLAGDIRAADTVSSIGDELADAALGLLGYIEGFGLEDEAADVRSIVERWRAVR